MLLGVIADDFTGATDIASFLVENGLSTIQLNGTPTEAFILETESIVISLKSRSCPKEIAISDSLRALEWLKRQGCQHFYFKYCSTFDSTANGNIGPVIDAILDNLGEPMTVISPALPVNGRTVYQGYLFVNDLMLADSPMQFHPVTPMTDSNLVRLIEAQGIGVAGKIVKQSLEQGIHYVQQQLIDMQKANINYVVLDALTEEDLLIQGAAVKDMRFVTGGAGLAIGLARAWAKPSNSLRDAQSKGYPKAHKTIVLSGSCSQMTNHQVAHYITKAASTKIDAAKVMDSTERKHYAKKLADWASQHSEETLAPIIYATVPPEALKTIQAHYGAEKVSFAIEALFSDVVVLLRAKGFDRFIVAGGETSGSVTQALGVKGFYIGPAISPGVPWVNALSEPIALALKSGNFGDLDFFARAQEAF